ncbi:hypothetical protein BGZ65_008185 [Modicella reniformis]|uniref:GDP-fucose protein O-fucosyltransferase 2 n=1 Tax=Modicella reniformis TaxID=1440133 RepID=A0A9P6MKD5_9FUNG|nr:hypothetical protein BGZ65_008185 [Modicella reniformis]
MSAIRTRKLISWILVLFVGLFLFHLTSRLVDLELGSIYNRDATQTHPTADNDQAPSTIARSSWPSEHTLDTRAVLRSPQRPPSQGSLKPPKGSLQDLSKNISPPKTLLDPSVKYLGYMTYAGLTNQFIALENAAYLAFRLNRTLIIPPITTNSHDKYNSNQRWSDFFDLARFTTLTGLNVVEWNDIRPLTQEQTQVGLQQAMMGGKPFPLWEALAENLTCQVVYGFGDSERLHTTEVTFARQFLLRPQFVRPPPRLAKTKVYDRRKIAKDNTNMEDIVIINDFLDRYANNTDQLLFLSHAFKLKDPLMRRSWNEVARYLHFVPKVRAYAQRLIEHRAPETKRNGNRYIAIHVRRGDIWVKCAAKPPEEMVDCVTPLGYYAEQLEKAYRIAGEKLPVIVTTDSKSSEDRVKMAKLGWRRLDHTLYTTEDELGIFGPAMVDASILADAEIMIGSYSSSMSRVAERRQMSCSSAGNARRVQEGQSYQPSRPDVIGLAADGKAEVFYGEIKLEKTSAEEQHIDRLRLAIFCKDALDLFGRTLEVTPPKSLGSKW